MEESYIELKPNNLYRNGRLLVFTADGEEQLVRDKIQTVGTLEDEYHTVTDRDRLDLLAYQYYANTVEDASKYWWVIADANNVHDPLDLNPYVGKKLLIPNILNTLLTLEA